MDSMEKLARELARSFHHTFGMVSHQREGYEHFIHYQLRSIVAESSPIVVETPQVVHRVHMENVTVSPPVVEEANGFVRRLSAREAIQRRLTYQATVHVDLRHEVFRLVRGRTYRLASRRLCRNVLLFAVPCMIGSSICELGLPGETGMFVINGHLKCLITQEDPKTNHPFVAYRGKGVYRCELRSHHADKIRSTSTLRIHLKKGKQQKKKKKKKGKGGADVGIPELNVDLPYIPGLVPAGVVFRLLGARDFGAMLRLVVRDADSRALKFLAYSVLLANDGPGDLPDEALFDWMSRDSDKCRERRVQQTRNVFRNECFPHCGDVLPAKAFCLGMCVRRLLRLFLGEIEEDDRDSYVNRRNTTAGPLIARLSRQLMTQFVKSVYGAVHKAVRGKRFVSITDFFRSSKITDGLRYAFSTGKWGVQKGLNNQKGFCQVLNTMNLVAKLSHMRKVNVPLNRDMKNPKPRQLHPSSFGIICAAETPESKSVGLLKSYAFFARVRQGCAPRYVIRVLLEDMGVVPIGPGDGAERPGLVLVDGVPVGFSPCPPAELARTYREFRRWHTVPVDSSVSVEGGRVHINADAGDLVRPLLRADGLDRLPAAGALPPALLWTELLIRGVLEYVNKQEELSEHTLVAVTPAELTPDHTHLEIHPSLSIHGVAAGIIPFCNRNQAPRNIYSASMSQQAVSCPQMVESFQTKRFSLCSPQRPVCTTITADTVGYPEQPAGQACVVAIMCHTGYNVEDSLIVNEASLQRGLFRTEVTHTYRDCETQHKDDEQRFAAVPEGTAGRKRGRYSLLAEDGLVAPGQRVGPDDILIGKVIDYKTSTERPDGKFAAEFRQRDRSTQAREAGVVKRVVLSACKEMRSAHVQTTAHRQPEVGDKLTSMMGQKGIIGMVVPQVDMPRTADGTTPDIIMVHPLSVCFCA